MKVKKTLLVITHFLKYKYKSASNNIKPIAYTKLKQSSSYSKTSLPSSLGSNWEFVITQAGLASLKMSFNKDGGWLGSSEMYAPPKNN